MTTQTKPATPALDRALTPPGPGPVDVDAIEARALAAPGGTWEAYPDMARIPWTAPDDDAPDGRYLVMMRGDWHSPEDAPGGVWEFLAAARADVLALVALTRWLSEALASALTASTTTSSGKEEASR